MSDQDKTREQLIDELADLRQRVAALEGVDLERRRAEEVLRQSEGRYRALAESTRDIIYILDRQGTLLYANRAASQCIGIRCDEIPGKRQADLFPPEMAQAHVERIGRVFATGELLEEDELFHFGAEEVWLRIHLLPLRDESGQVTSVMGVCHNITERKRAERELAKHRVMLQATIDCLPFNFFAIGLDGRYMLQNAVSKTQMGADVIGRRPEEVCPNEHDLSIWMENNRRAFAGEKIEGEVTLSLTGEEQSYYNVITPISDGRELYGILGVNIDITQRKRAEEALQKAHDELEEKVEERTAELTRANQELAIFRKFAETSGQGFSMADLDGRLLYLNPTLCRMLGDQGPEDRVGQHLSVCYPEESNRRGRQEIEPALKREGYWQGELPVLSRQGKSIPTWQSSFVIRDDSGNPLRLAVVITDITARKQAEDALRTSEEQYRGVAEACPDAIVMSDVSGGVLFASRQTWGLLGLAESDELVGRSVFDYVVESDRARLAENMSNLVGAGVRRNTEYAALRKDGTTFPAEVSSSVIRDGQGGVKAVMAVIRDVTERKRAEETLQRERQTLWHMLQASDHERQTISYEIHDGLAQYLAAAVMQFQSHDALGEGSPDKAKKAYETAVELVRQSHAEARRLVSEVRPPVIDAIGLETAISHLVHEQRRRGGPNIECQSDVQFGRLPAILENTLYRIVQEALTNACKHSKSKKVAVTMTQEGHDVRLEVRDWGIGFTPELVGRGHFGLEGIRQRVRLLGGRLTIESRPGSGTLVQVVVPVVERQNEG